MLAFQHARVAKLADARDLKSRDSKESYRFDSDPGHHPNGNLPDILPYCRAIIPGNEQD